MTVQDLINASLREGRIIAPDEGPSTAESTDCMLAANQLLDSFSAQAVPVYQMTREVFPLTGAASYMIGTGQVFNTARPTKIESALCVDSAGAIRRVDLATVEEWGSYTDKTRTGLFADLLWYDNGFPAATIWLAPKPVTGTSLELYSYKPLTQFASLAATVALPPGYERALIHALALEVWPQFRQGDPPPSLASLAADAKTAIFGLNQAILGSPSTVSQGAMPPVNAPVVPPAQ